MLGGSVLLQASDLTRRFSLASEVVTALERVDLAIHEGDFMAVMGPSGSGKTTLLNLLGGLDRPTEGLVTWRGGAFSELPEHELVQLRRKEIGLVFQDPSLMGGLDALSNVRLPLMFSGETNSFEPARSLLNRFELASKQRRLPWQLSRGEKQRVSIARALVSGPSLLLADEPTGNLDAALTRKTFSAFKELNEQEGLTVVVATHDDTVLKYATRKILLADGRIAEKADL